MLNILDFVTNSAIENFRKAFFDATGMFLSFADHEHKQYNMFNAGSRCEFCKIMNSTNKGLEACIGTSRIAGKEAARNMKAQIYKCHAGLSELYRIVPLGTEVAIVNGPYGPFGRGFDEINPGDRGADVMAIQQRLKQLGFYNGELGGILRGRAEERPTPLPALCEADRRQHDRQADLGSPWASGSLSSRGKQESIKNRQLMTDDFFILGDSYAKRTQIYIIHSLSVSICVV